MARIVVRRLDQREENTFQRKWWCGSLLLGLIVSSYFCLSIFLTFYQRVFLQTYKYPLSIVLVHLVFKFLVALCCRKFVELKTKKKRVFLCWHNQLHQIAPTGVASGLDVGFSNWGLEFVAVSLYTMTKSTSVVFILIFALIFKLEKKSWFLFVVVFMISAGLVLFNYEAAEFKWKGFIFILIASFSSGLRWTCAQFVMQRSDLNMSNPIDMLYHVQPWMMLPLLPIACIVEGPHMFNMWKDIHSVSYIFVSGLLGGAVLACAMEFAEYLVVSTTSSLTLSIVGIVKEIVTLAIAFDKERRHLSLMNVLGLIVCLSGVSSHAFAKFYRQAKQSRDKVSIETESTAEVPLLESSATTSGRFLLSSTDESEDDTEVLFNVLNSRDR